MRVSRQTVDCDAIVRKVERDVPLPLGRDVREDCSEVLSAILRPAFIPPLARSRCGSTNAAFTTMAALFSLDHERHPSSPLSSCLGKSRGVYAPYRPTFTTPSCGLSSNSSQSRRVPLRSDQDSTPDRCAIPATIKGFQVPEPCVGIYHSTFVIQVCERASRPLFRLWDTVALSPFLLSGVYAQRVCGSRRAIRWIPLISVVDDLSTFLGINRLGRYSA